MSLLVETTTEMADNGKLPEDVRWVGSRDGKLAMPWADFAEIADFDYDNGYGGQEIAKDLVVVGVDWWLERHEYDGAEWWEYKTIPTLDWHSRAFTRDALRGSSWGGMIENEGINDEQD